MVNKLVRDNIPTVIKKTGKIPIYQCIDNNAEFVRLLNRKLQEEVTEYLESNCVIELCDVVEVVAALINAHGISQAEFEHLHIGKAIRNGTFNERGFLSGIMDK